MPSGSLKITRVAGPRGWITAVASGLREVNSVAAAHRVACWPGVSLLPIWLSGWPTLTPRFFPDASRQSTVIASVKSPIDDAVLDDPAPGSRFGPPVDAKELTASVAAAAVPAAATRYDVRRTRSLRLPSSAALD